MLHDPLSPDPLPITVPMDLHDAMARAVSLDFAVSYLCGAAINGPWLMPRTWTARDKLKANGDALKVIADFGLRLGEPIPEADREPIPAVEAAKRRKEGKSKW